MAKCEVISTKYGWSNLAYCRNFSLTLNCTECLDNIFTVLISSNQHLMNDIFWACCAFFHRNFSSSNNTVNVVDSYFDLSNSFTCSQATCICDKKLKIIVIMIIILIQPVQRVVGFCCTLSKRGCDHGNAVIYLLQI